MKNSIALVLVPVLAACGSSHHNPTSADAPPTVDSALPVSSAVAVAGDYTPGHPGILTTVDVDTDGVMQNAAPQGAVGDDPVLRESGNELFVVNRADGNNVTILDATTHALVEQLGTGAGSNPQDVAVLGNKLYVPALGTAGVVVLTRGSNTTTTIDLGTPLGDPDGKPACVSAYVVGSQLFVACGLLDQNFTPRGPGKVAIIDTATDTFVSAVTLPFENPQSFFTRSPTGSMFGGDLLIPTVPSFTDYSTGCIARVSATTASCAITNHDLGGFASRIDVTGNALWIAVGTYDASFMNQTGTLLPFDLKQGLLGTRHSSASELIVDLAACPDGSIVATDMAPTSGGVRVYRFGGEQTTTALAIGLTPAFGDALVCY